MTTRVANLIREARGACIEFVQRDGGWVLIADEDTSPELLKQLRANREEVIAILSAVKSLRAAHVEVYCCSG